jgi:hypothetical protein
MISQRGKACKRLQVNITGINLVFLCGCETLKSFVNFVFKSVNNTGKYYSFLLTLKPGVL